MPTKLTRRADGRYRVKATVGHDAKGAPIIKYFYGETQREAAQKKKEYMDGLAVNGDARRMTVARWANEWLGTYAKGGYQYRENNKSIVRGFIRFTGVKANRPINDVKHADIQAYAKSISSYSMSRVNQAKFVVRQIFDTAKANGYVGKNPCDDGVWDGVKTGTRNMVDEETRELIRAHWRDHTAGVWAMFVMYAGLRPSEAFALRRENIKEDGIHVVDGSHFEHNKLVITPGQTKSEAGQRIIPILPPLREVIDTLPESGFVCTSTKGKPVTKSAYKVNWESFCKIIGKKIGMYTLRHTFCSMLYDAGVDVKTAQYLMGHADLSVTMKVYTHLSEQKKQRSYDQLFKYFESDLSGGQIGGQ